MAIATAASPQTTPAGVEFALLQSWLASGNALQLPLHEIECRQQGKGREVQRLLLQAHLQQRGNGDVGPALCPPTPGRRTALLTSPARHPCSHHRLWNRRTGPHGLLLPWLARHLSTGSDSNSARPLVLLRTSATAGQSRRAESFPGFGPNHS